MPDFSQGSIASLSREGRLELQALMRIGQGDLAVRRWHRRPNGVKCSPRRTSVLRTSAKAQWHLCGHVAGNSRAND